MPSFLSRPSRALQDFWPFSSRRDPDSCTALASPAYAMDLLQTDPPSLPRIQPWAGQDPGVYLQKATGFMAETVVRDLDLPAMANTPMYQLTFPGLHVEPLDETEDVVEWLAPQFESSFRDGLMSCWVARCNITHEVVGCCAYSVGDWHPADDSPVGWSLYNARASGFPASLDIRAWIWFTNSFARERMRVQNLCRKPGHPRPMCKSPPLPFHVGALLPLTERPPDITYLAVHPAHRRRGIGRHLIQRMCLHADRHGRLAHIFATDSSY